MGKMIDGAWRTDDQLVARTDGRYERADSSFRDWVTADGAPGPSGEGGFRAEPGRYHLYVATGCPWAHRTVIFRRLKGLEEAVSLSVVSPRRSDQGWIFDDASADHKDHLFGAGALHEIYAKAQPGFSGRVTVPVLWDKERATIVNNESSEIIRMLNGAFDAFGDASVDFYPEKLRAQIDEINDLVYRTVNNGVYRSGFARSQEAYEEAVAEVFETLDRLDARLASRRYLVGDRLTEADWRLFPTLARFDVAYYGAFKCNLRRLMDYANLWPYARELYQVPGVAETVDLDTYKRGYYSISALRNPAGIVPKGPLVDFSAPHGRERLAA